MLGALVLLYLWIRSYGDTLPAPAPETGRDGFIEWRRRARTQIDQGAEKSIRAEKQARRRPWLDEFGTRAGAALRSAPHDAGTLVQWSNG